MSTRHEIAGQQRLDRKARRLAAETNLPYETVRAGLEAGHANRPYRLEFVRSEGGPFYSTYREGSQIVLELNAAHPFVSLFYLRLRSPRSRSQVEVMLWAVALAEHAAGDDIAHSYVLERNRWSAMLGDAATCLFGPDGVYGSDDPNERF